MGKNRPKRIKRHHLKRWSSSVVSAGPTPNQEMIADYARRARYWDLRLLHMMGFAPSLDDKVTDARLAVLDRLEILKQEVPSCNNICLHNGRYTKVFMFYSSRGDEYYFVRHELTTLTMSKSITYGSRTRAMERFKSQKISWIEYKDLPDGRQELPG